MSGETISEDKGDLPLRVALAVRNGLASIVDQLNEILKESTPAELEWEKVHSVEADGQVLADFLVNPDKARLQPKRSLPTGCGPFGWLVSTLDRYREKHPNFRFQVEERNNQLYGIDFPCQIEDEKRLVSWFQWALKRMAEKGGGSESGSGWERRNQALKNIQEAGKRLTGEGHGSSEG